MIATISKEFAFSAAHRLTGLDADHPCARLHGHNYTVRVSIAGMTDDVGMVLDYGRLKPFGDIIDQQLDHRSLNDVMRANPTAENLAAYLLDVLTGVVHFDTSRIRRVEVAVSETPKTWASVAREYPITAPSWGNA